MELIKKSFVLIVVLGVIFISAGCGGGGGTSSGSVSTVPVIKNISVPNASSSDGGDITIQATITDQNAIVGAYAEITTAVATGDSVTLTKQGNTNVYKGTYSVPENLDLVAKYYSLAITAIDSKGNTTVSSPVIFSVPASSTPPPPPPDPV